ncbi:hypothetical protein [Microbacterium sp. P5_E9]
MSARATLLAAISAAVPAGTHVIPYQDNVDVLDAVTVMFKQLSMLPLDEAKRAAFRVNYVLTVVHPSADPSKSEAALDDFVPALLADLNTLDWFAWDTADKVIGPGGIGLAYDISCWTIAQSSELAPPLTPSTTTRKTRSRKEQTNG